MKVIIDYPCGCQVVDAHTIYTNPQQDYSLQTCQKHLKELRDAGYNESN